MNAASYTAAGLPHSGVAPGARFVLLGKDLATGDAVEQQNPEPSLAGVSAKITSGGVTVDGLIVLVSATRIEVVLPRSAAIGTGTVTLTVNGKDLTAPIEVVDSALGVRTDGQRGSGLATAFDASTAAVTLTSPAVVGDLVRVRTTGIGADNELSTTTILVGGKSVAAAGITRYPNGWDDIDFELPAVESACGVSIAVVNRGRISNFASLPVGTRGTVCEDAGLPPGVDRDKALREGARVGAISLIRSEVKAQTILIRSDAGSGAFFEYPAQTVGGGASVSSIGSCYLLRTVNVDTATFTFKGLDAGAELAVGGPLGPKTMTTQAVGSYSGRLGEQTQFEVPGVSIPPMGTLYLNPGDYTITGPGGADVGPFTAKLTVDAPVTWTNADTIGTACGMSRCVNRSNDLRIEWQGGDSKRLVTVQGIASVPRSNPAIGVIFTCTERSDRGSLTVPAAILSALPASSEENGVLNFSVISNGEPFTASGIDWGTISYTQFALRLTGYR